MSGGIYVVLTILVEYLTQLTFSSDKKQEFTRALDDDVEREEMLVDTLDPKLGNDISKYSLIAKNLVKH